MYGDRVYAVALLNIFYQSIVNADIYVSMLFADRNQTLLRVF